MAKNSDMQAGAHAHVGGGWQSGGSIGRGSLGPQPRAGAGRRPLLGLGRRPLVAAVGSPGPFCALGSVRVRVFVKSPWTAALAGPGDAAATVYWLHALSFRHLGHTHPGA